MTQKKFSTIEECCEFVRLFSQLAEQKSKEEINNDVIDMHIALTKHIDEYVNRVCARHKLKCSVALNYRIRNLGKCYNRTCFIELNPELLFYGLTILEKLSYTNSHILQITTIRATFGELILPIYRKRDYSPKERF